MPIRFLRAVALGALFFLGMLSPGVAQDGQREAAVKAAFLYNFAKFTDWPNTRSDSESGPVLFCVTPNSPLRASIEELHGKPVGSRVVRAVVLTAATNPAACHVLFLDESSAPGLKQIAQTDLHGVLTVSDIPNFAPAGGTIGFVYAANQLRFQINLDAARRSGISFSSKLLRLADIIGKQSGLLHQFAKDWLRPNAGSGAALKASS